MGSGDAAFRTFLLLACSVSTVFEVVFAFIGRKDIDEVSDIFPESMLGVFFGFAQQGFEFGEEVFNRIEVGTTGWQIVDRGPYRFDGLLHSRHFMAA